MRSLFVVLAAAVAACSLEAQVAVAPGARIRFTGQQLREHEVTVLEHRGDSLRVVPKSGAPYTVAAKDLGRVRVSLGKSHLLGMGSGLLWGAGVGTGLGLLTASDAECEDYCGEPVQGLIVVSSAIAGGIFGGLIGAFVGKESWADASPMVPRPVVRLGSNPALGFSFSRAF